LIGGLGFLIFSAEAQSSAGVSTKSAQAASTVASDKVDKVQSTAETLHTQFCVWVFMFVILFQSTRLDRMHTV
jgi:hypothetical protein